MKMISLSPSKLNVFNGCPRCFWDANSDAKCPKPRGIVASLPGGMDLIFKTYVDQFRGKLPLGLSGLLPGVLMANQEKMNKWRHWKTGLTYIDEVNQIKLIGALDDCLVDRYFHIPLDWKTKGSEPDTDGSEYYQTQMDCYNLMLSYNGLAVLDQAYLVYVYPKAGISQLSKNKDGTSQPVSGQVIIVFGMKPFRLTCNRERARELVIKAAECLRKPRPEASLKCEHCRYLILEDELTRQTKAEEKNAV